jgi:DNA-binding protein
LENDFYLGAPNSFDHVLTLMRLLKRKYHLNVHVRKRGSTFAKCIVYEFLKDLICKVGKIVLALRNKK